MSVIVNLDDEEVLAHKRMLHYVKMLTAYLRHPEYSIGKYEL